MLVLSYLYLDEELVLWTEPITNGKKKKELQCDPGIISSLVMHPFPIFVSQHFNCLLHPLWLFLCNEHGPMRYPEGITSSLMKRHTFLCTVQELWWTASSTCCVEQGKCTEAQSFSSLSFPTERINKSESSCACSGCRDGTSDKM